VWYNTGVKENEISDPYLMTGFDKKSVHLYHDSGEAVDFTIQTDFMGNGDFRDFTTISVKPGEYVHYEFPDAYSANWMRFTVNKTCKATAIVQYN